MEENNDDGYDDEDDSAKQVFRGIMYAGATAAAVGYFAVKPAIAALKTMHAKEIAAIDNEINIIKSQVDILKNQLNTINARIENLETEIKTKKQRLTNLHAELSQFKKACAEETEVCDNLIGIIGEIQQEIFNVEVSTKKKSESMKFQMA